MEGVGFWLPVVITTAGTVAGGLWFVYQLAVKPMNDKLALHEKYHSKHFESVNSHAVGLAEVQRSLEDHKKVDDDRFDEMREMVKEIRGDIKQLIKAASEK